MKAYEKFFLLKDGLAQKAVTVRRSSDGKLQYEMLRGSASFFLPPIKHYRRELLAELGGPPVPAEDTYARFMALPLVQCVQCTHHRPGPKPQDNCEVRDPAAKFRCIWFEEKH